MPVRTLLSSHNCSRFVKLESEGGIVPFNLLLENDKKVRRVNWEMVDGILPVRRFLSRSKAVSFVKSPISLGIMVPIVESPPLKLLNLSVVRQSAKDGCPMNLHAISSGVVAEVGTAVGLCVTGEGVGAIVDGGSVGGDVSPVGRGRVTNTTANTIPTTTRVANKQPPTITARYNGRSCHFFCSGE